MSVDGKLAQTDNPMAGSTPPRPGRGSPPEKRLYSVKEAAGYLGLSPWTVRETIWRGELPSVRAGRRVLLDLRDLDAFVERNKRTEIL